MNIVVYTMALNEEKNVEQYMRCANEADGVVIIDTGSTDKTRQALLDLGATVITYSGAFSAAKVRNTCLLRVTCAADICVTLDLDEVFDPGWRAKLEQDWKLGTTRLLYPFVQEFNDDGTEKKRIQRDCIHARFGYQWKYRCHEALLYDNTKSEEKIAKSDLLCKHYPDKTRSRIARIPLLEADVHDFPNDPRCLFNLAREYFVFKHYAQAENWLYRCLEIDAVPERKAHASIMLAWIAQYSQNEVWRKKMLLRAAEIAPNQREPWLHLAEYYVEYDKLEKAAEMLQKALSIKKHTPLSFSEARCWDGTIEKLLERVNNAKA